MSKLFSITLVLVLILGPMRRLASSQNLVASSSEVAKMKAEITRRSRGDDSNVIIKLRNGTQLKGRITLTSENMFTLKEDKTRIGRDIYYADVAKVNGRGLSRPAKFGILTAILSGAVVIGVLVGMRNMDPLRNGVLR